MSTDVVYDVIILGAGLSGLSTGYHLKKAHRNLNILILEAKDRVGGRTQTVELKCSKDGVKMKWDAGGQWVTNSQHHITELINEFNLETYKQFDEGTNVLETNGKLVTYNSHIPRINLSGLLDLQRMLFRCNWTANKVNTMEPFLKIEQAKKLDSSNIDQFFYTHSFSQVARSVVDAAIRTVYGLEPKEINTLFGLMYIKSGGSIESLTLSDPNCAQEKRVKGGTQQISQRLLDSILSANHNNKVLFTRPVIRVDQSNNEYVVITTRNAQTNIEETFKARKVVSSIPLNQYCTIKFEPELPLFKRNVLNSCKMGNYAKILITYKTAFWRLKGYSGAVVTDSSVVTNKIGPKHGPLAIVYDATNDQNEPALVGFICAQSAVEWLDLDPKLRQKEVIDSMIRFFGQEAGNFVEYFEKNWSFEPYSGGCPTVNVLTSGVMQDYVRATREPFLNTHFCGTESATVWQGYMDGAVESGIRAANEILYDSYRGVAGVSFDYNKTYYHQKDEIEKYRKAHPVNSNTNSFYIIIFVSFLIIIVAIYFKCLF